MAGSFSGHLVDSFFSAQSPRAPFGRQNSPSQLAYSGPMSFAPQMHGTFKSELGSSSSSFAEPSFMDLSEETARRIATLQAKLDKKLGPEYISQRPGPGGGPKLTYAEGWKIINLANEVFGFNGWSSSITSMTVDFCDHNEESRRYNVGVTAIVRVTLRDGVFHEDIGYGSLENSKSKGAALDKCKKEAVTDGVKRALRNFGNLMGNCLYDKSFTQEIVKIKVPPPKFDRSELHRRPEFEDTKSKMNANIPPKPENSASVSIPARTTTTGPAIKSEAGSNAIRSMMPPPPLPAKSLSSIPPHTRAGQSVSISDSKSNSPIGRNAQITPCPAPGPALRSSTGAHNMPTVTKTGLNTPVHTTAHASTSTKTQYQQAPAPAPPQHHQHQPQYQGPASATERHVSFAQPAAAASSTTAPPQELPEEDEYLFNSEDDAFLATVDLGEGDEGLGGHIDFEEGLGGVNVTTDELSVIGHLHEKPVAQQQQFRPPLQPLQPVQPQFRFNPPPQPQFKPPQPPLQPKSEQPQFKSAAHLQQQLGPARPAAYTNINHNSNNQNENPNPNPSPNLNPNPDPSSSSNSTPNGSSKPSTPSMGGFHFPPGVNPPNLQSRTLKRGADTMQTTRPAQGMGLAHHAGGMAGGDTKRLRR